MPFGTDVPFDKGYLSKVAVKVQVVELLSLNDENSDERGMVVMRSIPPVVFWIITARAPAISFGGGESFW